MSCLMYWLWVICVMLFSSVHPVFSDGGSVLYCPASGTVSWEVETRIMHIGETVVLTCTVNNVTAIDPKQTRQWSKGSSLICYNGKPTNPWKYKESLNRNTFKLHIYNTTEADLNSEYECLYSFDTSSKKLKITAENFENPPNADTTDLQYNYDAINGFLHVELHMRNIFPLPNCTVFLQVLQLNFAESTYTENGLYFDVHLEHKWDILLKESTHFNVTCQLLKEYFIVNRIIIVPKDMNYVITSDERPKRNITFKLIVFIPLILLYLIILVVGVVVYCQTRKRNRKQKKTRGEGYL